MIPTCELTSLKVAEKIKQMYTLPKNVHEQKAADAEPKKIKYVLFTRETFSDLFHSSGTRLHAMCCTSFSFHF